MTSMLLYVLTRVETRADKRHFCHAFFSSDGEHVLVFLPKSWSEQRIQTASEKLVPKKFIMMTKAGYQPAEGEEYGRVYMTENSIVSFFSKLKIIYFKVNIYDVFRRAVSGNTHIPGAIFFFIHELSDFS